MTSKLFEVKLGFLRGIRMEDIKYNTNSWYGGGMVV
jgi:hypothetical protein